MPDRTVVAGLHADGEQRLDDSRSGTGEYRCARGEIAGQEGSVRGTSLEDVVHALRPAWALRDARPEAPVLAMLPAVGHQR